ncbi:unnamed protein product [Clonostachys solani]|uniref:Heterokaryon incompatibility domain-containing protein n=1 Tax=Clonostachys solani TaxID=160281 RepID=A0A9N9Z245_9HYPO|nr:unnamed protein product [Clonostachys solani]
MRSHKVRQPPSSAELYTPLGPGEIRVLEIFPAWDSDGESTVSCRLVKTNMTRGVKYSALSYVWGPRLPTKYITINGVTRPVTINLACALKSLRNTGALDEGRRLEGGRIAPLEQPHHGHKRRHHSGSRFTRALDTMLPGSLSGPESVHIWVDAVCINQADLAERNQQVAQMASIYKNAQQVISWLGESDEFHRLDLGLNLVHGIYQSLRPRQSKNPNKRVRVDVNSGLEWVAQQADLLYGYEDGKTPNIHWDGALNIGKCEYWTRVWIIQEIAMARSGADNILLCGDTCATYAEYCAFSAFLGHLAEAGKRLWGPIDNTVRILLSTSHGANTAKNREKQIRAIQNGKFNATMLLISAMTHRATDPKDMIYGFQSLMSDTQTSVDYGLSVRDVYLNWAREDFRAFRITDMTMWTSGIGLDSYRNTHGLPSWFPDLSTLSSLVEVREPIDPHPSDTNALGLLSQVVYQVNPKAVKGQRPELTDSLDMWLPSVVFGEIDMVVQGEELRIWEPRHSEKAFEMYASILSQFRYGVRAHEENTTTLGALFHAIYQGRDPFDNAPMCFPLDPTLPSLQFFVRGIRYAIQKYPCSKSVLDELGLTSHEQLWPLFCRLLFGPNLSQDQCDLIFPAATPFSVLVEFNQEHLEESSYSEFLGRLTRSKRVSFFKTRDGYLGMGPRYIRPGDKLVASGISTLPSIVRESDNTHYYHVGTCYIAGFGPDELSAKWGRDEVIEDTLTLR